MNLTYACVIFIIIDYVRGQSDRVTRSSLCFKELASVAPTCEKCVEAVKKINVDKDNELKRIIQKSEENIIAKLDKLSNDFGIIKNLMKEDKEMVIKVEKEQKEIETKESEDSKKKKLKNCLQLKRTGDNTSGIRVIYPNKDGIEVFCEQDFDEGGWTVIQNRDRGLPQVDFNRGWSDYTQGFGNMSGQFWIGLENIHLMTTSSSMMQLVIQLHLPDLWNVTTYFDTFSVGNSTGNFKSTVGSRFSSSLYGVPLDDGLLFSTSDRDNDEMRDKNCAREVKSGWWFKKCEDECELTSANQDLEGLRRVGPAGSDQVCNELLKIRMMIRPKLDSEFLFKEGEEFFDVQIH